MIQIIVFNSTQVAISAREGRVWQLFVQSSGLRNSQDNGYLSIGLGIIICAKLRVQENSKKTGHVTTHIMSVKCTWNYEIGLAMINARSDWLIIEI